MEKKCNFRKMDQITKSSFKRIKDETDSLASQRVYKKTSANSVLTLYLGSRDLISKRGIVEPLKGVIYVDPKFTCSQKIYGQLTLTFRYGREDEEVMGLKFCNEAVISLKQIWPKVNYDDDDINPLQQALLDRLGCGAYPFTLEIGMLAPPSVQLIPAKKYNGAPIGTSYDVRVFISDSNDEKFQRRTTVKLGIRLLHKVPNDLRSIQQTNPTYTSLPKSIRLRLSPKHLKFHHHHRHQQQNSSTSKSVPSIDLSSFNPPTTTNVVSTHPLTLSASEEIVSNNKSMTTVTSPSTLTATSNNDTTSENLAVHKGPEGCIDKPFLWTEGRVSLKASLNKSAYGHGEQIYVTVDIKNNSRKVIRKIRVFAVQHVDVCMFSNGKFKNVVADVNENHQIKPNETYKHTYEITPVKGPTKNWIAVEGTYSSYALPSSPTTATKSSQQHYQQRKHSTINEIEPDVSTTLENDYKIASSAHRGTTTADERNVFAIYVSYYVKVKLTLSGMGGEASLKLPFILGHVDNGNDGNNDKDFYDESKTNQTDNIIKEIKNLNISSDNNTLQNKTKTTNNDKNTINCCSDNSNNNSNKISNKYQTTASIHTYNNCNCVLESNEKIKQEEKSLYKESDTISIINDDDIDDSDDKDDKKKQNEEDKHNQDKILLKRYKLKRSSYSRSCEDIETYSKCSVNSICAKAIIHRQESENND